MANPHELTTEEKRLSAEASKSLGFGVLLFRDGDWICQPVSLKYEMGFGSNSEAAVEDCRRANQGR